jgi:hypothetical protein
MSGSVCEPCPENGSTKQSAALCHLSLSLSLFFNLVTLPPQHMGYFSRPLEMMQFQEHKPFHWHKMFSEGRTLVEDEQRSGMAISNMDR